MEASTSRRLPVYFVLDCSGSMAGDPIQALQQGIKGVLSDARGDAQALESVHFAVITFANEAQQLCPLTDLANFQEPNLQAGGGTSMGAGLSLLAECISREVKASAPGIKGDYKPIVFVMTDGEPTDSWQESVAALKRAKIGNIIGCACGAGANVTMLRQLTETVVLLQDLKPGTFKMFFRWISASIRAVSQQFGQPIGGAPAPVSMPALPAGIKIVP